MEFSILILSHLIGKHRTYDVNHMELSENFFYVLKLFYINCSPWTRSISITQRIVTNAGTHTPPHLLNQNPHFNST